MKWFVGFALLLLTMAAVAADATGKWTADVEGPDGTIKLVFNLKADGEKLTGSVTGPMGDTPISDGTVKGDEIAFTVMAGEMKIVHKGTVGEDEIKMTVDFGEQQMPMVMKRAKAE